MLTFDDYFKIRKTAFKLYQVLNYPTFFIVVYSINCIFIPILLIMKYQEALVSEHLSLLDVYADLTTGVIILVSHTVFSSKVTENFLT